MAPCLHELIACNIKRACRYYIWRVRTSPGDRSNVFITVILFVRGNYILMSIVTIPLISNSTKRSIFYSNPTEQPYKPYPSALECTSLRTRLIRTRKTYPNLSHINGIQHQDPNKIIPSIIDQRKEERREKSSTSEF